MEAKEEMPLRLREAAAFFGFSWVFFGSHTCPHYTGNREAGGTIDQQVEIIEAFVVLD